MVAGGLERFDEEMGSLDTRRRRREVQGAEFGLGERDGKYASESKVR